MIRLWISTLIVAAFSVSTSADISCGQNNINGKGFQSQPQWTDVSRIIGGRDAQPGEVPWIADLSIKINGRYAALCGGAIVDKYTVMTAAHCMFACSGAFDMFFCPNRKVEGFKVCVGILNKRNQNAVQCYETTTFYVHPQYRCCGQNNFHDIAIIKIPQGMDEPKFTSDGQGSTNAICLPPASDAKREYSGKAIIAGFGRINPSNNQLAQTLQVGTVNFISTQQCKNTFGSAVDNTQVCVYSDDTSSCNGDSGSALYVQDQSGVATAVGLTSFGRVNCQNSAVVYTKVAAFRDFINQHSGQPK